MQTDLIKQSIADAKALRQSAYELAKEQIAESFGPRVQEMIKLKLSEMEDDLDEAKEDELDEMKHKEDELAEGMDDSQMEEDLDEATLDQMLAELEEGEDEEPVEESAMKGYTSVGKSSKNSMKEADGDDEEAEEEEEEPAEEPAEAESEEVTEMTVDELKDIIRMAVADAMGGQAAPEGGDSEGGEIDLGSAGAEGGEESGEEESMEEITLDEILASLEEKDSDMLQEKKGVKKPAKKEEKEEEKSKKELKEAVQTIKALQRELNEVNLLNAKLLYVNKLFKGATLNESQKLNVITAFDRAETVKEAKKIYETLKDSLVAKPSIKKNSLKESVGFASKASGIVPRQQKPIVEQDNIVNRWQVLAGIKKIN